MATCSNHSMLAFMLHLNLALSNPVVHNIHSTDYVHSNLAQLQPEDFPAGN